MVLSNNTRGILAGGEEPSSTNKFEYTNILPLQQKEMHLDFGDLTDENITKIVLDHQLVVFCGGQDILHQQKQMLYNM